MLDRNYRIEVGDQQDAPQRQLVALRIVARSAVEVLDRVDIEQCGPVGELREHSQGQPGGQQRRRQPVPSQNASQGGKAPGRGRHPGHRSRCAPVAGARRPLISIIRTRSPMGCRALAAAGMPHCQQDSVKRQPPGHPVARNLGQGDPGEGGLPGENPRGDEDPGKAQRERRHHFLWLVGGDPLVDEPGDDDHRDRPQQADDQADGVVRDVQRSNVQQRLEKPPWGRQYDQLRPADEWLERGDSVAAVQDCDRYQRNDR